MKLRAPGLHTYQLFHSIVSYTQDHSTLVSFHYMEDFFTYAVKTILELEMLSTVYIFNREILQRTKIEKHPTIRLMLLKLWFSNSYPCIDLLIIDCFHDFRTLSTLRLFPTWQIVIFIQNSLCLFCPKIFSVTRCLNSSQWIFLRSELISPRKCLRRKGVIKKNPIYRTYITYQMHWVKCFPFVYLLIFMRGWWDDSPFCKWRIWAPGVKFWIYHNIGWHIVDSS